MIYQDKEVKLKDGRSAVLRNARVEDSADLIKYLKTTQQTSVLPITVKVFFHLFPISFFLSFSLPYPFKYSPNNRTT